MSQTAIHPDATRAQGKGFGYLVAAAVNVLMLIVANNILDWGWLPFLTDEFTSVLWLINISLGATILFNLIYMGYDPAWFKATCQMVGAAISIVVLIRMYQVFPFDFSAYEFGWGTLLRVLLVLGMVGTAIGLLVELGKLIRALLGAGPSPSGAGRTRLG